MRTEGAQRFQRSGRAAVASPHTDSADNDARQRHRPLRPLKTVLIKTASSSRDIHPARSMVRLKSCQASHSYEDSGIPQCGVNIGFDGGNHGANGYLLNVHAQQLLTTVKITTQADRKPRPFVASKDSAGQDQCHWWVRRRAPSPGPIQRRHRANPF
jgi:hypothetical protein